LLDEDPLQDLQATLRDLEENFIMFSMKAGIVDRVKPTNIQKLRTTCSTYS